MLEPVSLRFIILLLGELGRQLVEAPLSAAISPNLNHPPDPCIKR